MHKLLAQVRVEEGLLKKAGPHDKAGPELAKARDLVGDLNAQWDRVAREMPGSPEVRKLAQRIEDLEMAIATL